MLSLFRSTQRRRRSIRLAAAHAALRRANLRANAWAAVSSARLADCRPLPVLFATLDGLTRSRASLRAARCWVTATELEAA